jgi:hypothetical protein
MGISIASAFRFPHCFISMLCCPCNMLFRIKYYITIPVYFVVYHLL